MQEHDAVTVCVDGSQSEADTPRSISVEMWRWGMDKIVTNLYKMIKMSMGKC
nr:MAG TPA: hypothetical protein [Caudoviricetes sp.]